jgi:hypothetical protein
VLSVVQADDLDTCILSSMSSNASMPDGADGDEKVGGAKDEMDHEKPRVSWLQPAASLHKSTPPINTTSLDSTPLQSVGHLLLIDNAPFHLVSSNMSILLKRHRC